MPSEIYRQEIKERSFKAIMSQDFEALEHLFLEVYATGYSSGYSDKRIDSLPPSPDL